MIPCSKCSRRFRNNSGLTRHYNAIHKYHPGLDVPISEFQRDHHPFLTGVCMFQDFFAMLTVISVAKRCNKHGEFFTSNVPPALSTTQPATDWFPFNSHVGFELADFIFTEAELSKRKVNRLLELWAATLVPHGVPPPITDNTDLLRQIDSIPLGGVPWESFHLNYDGPPEPIRPPEWKITKYEVWFRNPREVIKGILGNSEFNGHIDYSAYREFEGSQRHYCNMMSGDWAWKQSVRCTVSRHVTIINS